jgi:hypothetical protein
MGRTTRLVLVCLGSFLVLFPLTLSKPGVPATFKADEPAYYLMALSLARDADLRVEIRDVDRVFEEFPFSPAQNLLLMSPDRWSTVYYGKPYLYSLFAAPFVAAFGANGMVAFNMLLTLGMVWMGTLWLRRWNPEPLAALFAASFFLLSVGFSYVFWMQPEVFNMAAVAACLFFGLHEPGPEGVGERRWWWAALSGAALALAVYNKPMLAALGVPVLWRMVRGRRVREAGAWLAGAALSLALAAGISVALTGKPTAYLGMERAGLRVCRPGEMPIQAETTTAEPRHVEAQKGGEARSWFWIFRIPKVPAEAFLENLGYFLWGRHTGLLLYMPFGALAVLLFLLHGRRSGVGWAIVGALAVVALFFLLFIPFNWHGGGGFVGNRYFVNAYPAFLFLVTRIAPAWTVAAGYAWSGLFLSTLVFQPLGLAVAFPTLQSHTRNIPFRLFPLELSLQGIPGYHRVGRSGARVVARRDLALPMGETFWLRGGGEVEMWIETFEPVERLAFLVKNPAPGSAIELVVGEARERLELGRAEARLVSLRPGGPDRVSWARGQRYFVYKLSASMDRGTNRTWTVEVAPPPCTDFAFNPRLEEDFFTGAELTYLGPGEGLEKDLYALEWVFARVPPRVKAGETFEAGVKLVNRSRETWPNQNAARVALSYHWLDAAGKPVVWDGERTDLPRPVPPGESVAVRQTVQAPAAPGTYTLVLDPVFEQVAWFSDRNGGRVARARVEVVGE